MKLLLLFLVLPFVGQAEEFVQDIEVLSPAPLSDVCGKVKIRVHSSKLTHLEVYCMNESISHAIRRNGKGEGAFVVDTRRLPQGPFTLQIMGSNEEGERDIYELQLYNTDHRSPCRTGIPDTIPVGAQGMRLVFADDFDGPLSVSCDGRGARYNAHKPTFGDFSGWPFADPSDDVDGPFLVRDSYLVIQARKPEGGRGSTGLLATVDMDGKGFWAKAPFYMECRLTAQSAPGTWPAFWTVTNISRGAGDELDVMEAYGGWGEGNPNSTGYWVTTHYWGQTDADGKPLAAPAEQIDMMSKGHHTSWSQDFHTYGLSVTKDSTTYYLDDEPVLCHPTNSYSYDASHVVMVNYAIGGASGWKVDLERYGNRSNMYVDYIRVFEGVE
ncbi:MAG: family 16 glycosylhydrolase [Bacteroidales bacterium]|nr:family 16 glycosylhydrolase [Bacteroidales bacterium]